MDKLNVITTILIIGSILLSISLFLLAEAIRSYVGGHPKSRRSFSKRYRIREDDKIIVSPPSSPKVSSSDSLAERYELQQELEELKELRKDHIISQQEFQYQIGLMLGKQKGKASPQCRKTEEDKEVDELVRLKKEGLLTEAAFKRELDRIKFKKYL